MDALMSIIGMLMICLIVATRVIKNKCEMIEELKIELESVKKDLEDIEKYCPINKEIVFNSEGGYSIREYDGAS